MVSFIVTLTAAVPVLNFGFEQAPETSLGTAINTVAIPAGTNTFLIEPGNIHGSDGDGVVTDFRITQ